ncbi:MAG: MBL fold metallo-hydrolase [Spirochaetota bacterium]
MEDLITLALGRTNSYLLPCTGGYILVDTSYPDQYRKFCKLLNRKNIDQAQIKYVFLTHHHDDHAGFLSAVRKESNARLIAHAKSTGPLKRGGAKGAVRPANRLAGAVFAVFRAVHRDFRFPPVQIKDEDILVKEDDHRTLKEIGVDGAIVYTPGHTRDSVSMVLSDGRALVGDAAMNFMKWTGLKHRPILVENIHEVYKSWEKLLSMGATVIYPAHGKPFPSHELKW